MDNFGDWIYIIALLIAGISGIFNSGKKKRRELQRKATPQQTEREVETTQPQASPLPQGESFPEVLRRLSRRQPTIQTPPEPSLTRQNTAKGIFSEGVPVFSNRQDNTGIIAATEEQPAFTIDDMPSDIEEWRKAFVYQEIFQRKY